MATTPTYSWPIPDDTDLVKDGAEAIRDLGNAIDTTVGGLGSGLVHINTTPFSGVASQAVTFASTTYDNYRILINIDTNSLVDGVVYLKLRSGATDNSVSYSFAAFTKTRANNDSNFTGADVTTGWRLFDVDAGGSANTVSYTSCSIDLFDNFAAKYTKINYLSHFLNQSTLPSLAVGAGFHAVATSFDSINLISAGGTLTGQITTFGYRK